jgi:hypothetical protein
MIHIETEFPFAEEVLERAARRALEYASYSGEPELSILLTDDARLHGLNLN